MANFLRKRPDNKYFRFLGLKVAVSALLLLQESGYEQHVIRWCGCAPVTKSGMGMKL